MTGERRTMRYKLVPIAVLNYNTSHYSSLGCEHTRVLHRRIPYNVLDKKIGIKPTERFLPMTEMGEWTLQKTEQICDATQKSLMRSYIKKQEVLRQKSKCASTPDWWLLHCIEPESDDPNNINTIQRLYVDRTIYSREEAIQQQLYNHSSLGCEPTTVFHGRITYNVLDIKSTQIKPIVKKCMRISPPTANTRQTKCVYDRCHFQERWLCIKDWRRSQKSDFCTQDIYPSGIRIENVSTSPDKNVSLL